MTPSQQEFLDSPTNITICGGGKVSGKTQAQLDKITSWWLKSIRLGHAPSWALCKRNSDYHRRLVTGPFKRRKLKKG